MFSLLGERLAILVDPAQEAGYHQLQFDARGFASGLYIYRISAADFVETKKMIVLK